MNDFLNGNAVQDAFERQRQKQRERRSFDSIPDEAVTIINEFDLQNSKSQILQANYDELEVCVNIWSRHMEQTLLYSLNAGTAYMIENGNIYIWYAPYIGFDGAGWYKLKRFMFLREGSTIKYFLDGNEKLSKPL